MRTKSAEFCADVMEVPQNTLLEYCRPRSSHTLGHYRLGYCIRTGTHCGGAAIVLHISLLTPGVGVN